MIKKYKMFTKLFFAIVGFLMIFIAERTLNILFKNLDYPIKKTGDQYLQLMAKQGSITSVFGQPLLDEQTIPTYGQVFSANESWQQTDDALINYIRRNVLIPPDYLPYTIYGNTTKKWPRTSEYGTEVVLSAIFKDKRGGVFVEAGALDGQFNSNTLNLEITYNWTGLLVEGNPNSVRKLKATHRKAWVAPVLLSISTTPQTMVVNKFRGLSYIQPLGDILRSYKCPHKLYLNATDDQIENLKRTPSCRPYEHRERVQTIPLYALLKASGFTEVDFFSLDVEGSEIKILRHVPFQLLNIKVLLVEKNHHVDPSELLQIMERNNYKHLQMFKGIDITQTLPVDFMFIKRDFLSTLV